LLIESGLDNPDTAADGYMGERVLLVGLEGVEPSTK